MKRVRFVTCERCTKTKRLAAVAKDRQDHYVCAMCLMGGKRRKHRKRTR
jgi:hypothetical protein